MTSDHSRPSAELAARRTFAVSVLAEYRAERNQDDHLTDWLALAVKLANALDGLLNALDDDSSSSDYGPGKLMRCGGGWISGSST